MAAAAALFTDVEHELCTLCTNKYNRDRPSFCQCKHCSIPLCLDCMKQHHEELLQKAQQISHEYNQVQEVLQTKQTMIHEETAKSIENVNQYFDHYIDELRDTQKEIIEAMEKVKQDAHEYVHQMESDLQMLGNEIQSLTKESIVQMTKMKNASIELKKMEQKVTSYKAIRAENAIQTKPDFSIKFECSSVATELPGSTQTEVKQTQEKNLNESEITVGTANHSDSSSVIKKIATTQASENDNQSEKNEVVWVPEHDDQINDEGKMRIDTRYKVDRMASDGKNILYTSFFDKEADLIAYCLVDNPDKNVDQYRDWNQSRIIDMIWWNSVRNFICATERGIYTVVYVNKRFRIASVIPGRWSYIRVAANTNQLFVWMNSSDGNFDGIQIFSVEFNGIRTIDFETSLVGSYKSSSYSFCVTDNVIASICTRTQRGRQVSQVTLCDMDMKKLDSVPLGRCNDDGEIRTDGKDSFFVTTGERRFYIVSSNGEKQEMNLEDDGECIAILNERCIAVSAGRDNMEILTF